VSAEERLSALPAGLRTRTRFVRLAEDVVEGGVPALLAHPEENWWEMESPAPAPVVVWMHGRTVSKELDPGRYLRWVRAGIAACAIDMPGHGERFDASMQGAETGLAIVKRVAEVELDAVVRALAEARWRGAFDIERMGVGGMSLGGITTMVRLCTPHDFRCATVEAAAGDFGAMRNRRAFTHPEERGALSGLAKELDPYSRLDGWRPLPFLALHSEKDEWVPVEGIRSFVLALREHYAAQGADAESVQLVTWPETGAQYEHVGFGRMSNEAKNVQTEFLRGALGVG